MTTAVAPRIARKVPGMGTVYDFRGCGLCPPNGGRIRPLILVQHIPVVRNRPGHQDFVTLGNVLREQGLSIQAATDAEGNVALYTRLDELCYGQRGANMIACGVEHMHMSVDEPWEERQMRAAAWVAHRAWRDYAIPPQMAKLAEGGNGRVKVLRRGTTSHKAVSAKAGYHDRADPGPGFEWQHLFELVRFYARHSRF